MVVAVDSGAQADRMDTPGRMDRAWVKRVSWVSRVGLRWSLGRRDMAWVGRCSARCTCSHPGCAAWVWVVPQLAVAREERHPPWQEPPWMLAALLPAG